MAAQDERSSRRTRGKERSTREAGEKQEWSERSTKNRRGRQCYWRPRRCSAAFVSPNDRLLSQPLERFLRGTKRRVELERRLVLLPGARDVLAMLANLSQSPVRGGVGRGIRLMRLTQVLLEP